MYVSKEDKATIAVVTGAGAGLGRALSIEFARRGIRVVGLGRQARGLQETADLALGAPFVPLTVDVGDPVAVSQAFERIAASVGAPDILINNAAVHPRRDALDETPEDFMHCMAINLGGAVNCTYASLRTMVQTGKGRIVNVGSFADIAPQPGDGAYCVSKGALRIFSRTLVADLGDRFPGIVISTWMPGILATRMGLPDGLDPAAAASWGVELALRDDPDLNGATFERDLQVVSPRSLKGRLLDRLTRRAKPPMRLEPTALA